MKKKEEEWDFNRFVEEVAGHLIIAIGKGEFRGSLWGFMQTLNSKAYDNGFADGLKEAARRKRMRK